MGLATLSTKPRTSYRRDSRTVSPIRTLTRAELERAGRALTRYAVIGALVLGIAVYALLFALA